MIKTLRLMNLFCTKITPINSKMQIVNKTKINHDSYIYRLKFTGPQFPINIGQHLKIIANVKVPGSQQKQEIIKSYTPISSCEDNSKNIIDILFKIYRPNQNPFHPLGGKLTPYIENLQIGQEINVQGPFGKFSYQSNGIVNINGKSIKVKKIFFIAGGSGITPVYQTLSEIIKMKDQKMKLILLFANKSQQDILLRKQLEEMQPRIQLYFTLDTPSEGWKGLEGRPNQQMLKKLCPLDDPQTLYIYCGPRGLNTFMKKLFQEKFPKSNIFKY